VCQGLHLIDTDCDVRLYSALNVCSGLRLVSTDSYVGLYTDIYDLIGHISYCIVDN
jgi:hypothetical protein